MLLLRVSSLNSTYETTLRVVGKHVDQLVISARADQVIFNACRIKKHSKYLYTDPYASKRPLVSADLATDFRGKNHFYRHFFTWKCCVTCVISYFLLLSTEQSAESQDRNSSGIVTKLSYPTSKIRRTIKGLMYAIKNIQTKSSSTW